MLSVSFAKPPTSVRAATPHTIFFKPTLKTKMWIFREENFEWRLFDQYQSLVLNSVFLLELSKPVDQKHRLFDG